MWLPGPIQPAGFMALGTKARHYSTLPRYPHCDAAFKKWHQNVKDETCSVPNNHLCVITYTCLRCNQSIVTNEECYRGHNVKSCIDEVMYSHESCNRDFNGGWIGKRELKIEE